MAIKTELYSGFKPYQIQKIAQSAPKQKFDFKPLIGAGLGAGLSFAALYTKNKRKDLSEIQTGARMVLMCACANLGGIMGGSVGKDKGKIKKKVKEGAFQMMNMAIPMTLVTGFHALCNRIKPLQKNSIKIAGSLAAMISGAFIATKITNAIKAGNETKRQYTIKDTLANFDDVVATVAIGFPEVAAKIPVNQIVPLIYTYNGARAGMAQ